MEYENQDLPEENLSDLSNEEVALSFKEITSTVGRLEKVASRLKAKWEMLEEDGDVPDATVEKAEENYNNVKEQIDKLKELENDYTEEINERDINTFEYY